MDFETLRTRFSGPDRRITLEQFRALSLDELMIRDAGLCRLDAGQARLYPHLLVRSINEFCNLLSLFCIPRAEGNFSEHLSNVDLITLCYLSMNYLLAQALHLLQDLLCIEYYVFNQFYFASEL